MRKIAVLGASGFIGSRLIELSVLKGESQIVPIVRSFAGVARLARFGVECRIANVDDENEIVKVVNDCDVVVNLTAGDSKSLSSQFRNIYRACDKTGVQTLIHTSSAVVFGEHADPTLSDRAASDVGHWSIYALEKARAEQFIESQTSSTLRTVTLRPGLVWGPRSPWVTGPLTALSNHTAYLVGSGAAICNLIFVDNFIESVLAVAHQLSPEPGFFNVADDEQITWREYYDALAAMVGVKVAEIANLEDKPYRSTVHDHVQAAKQMWWFQTLKGFFKAETRRRIKSQLKELRSSIVGTGETAPRPDVTRDIWTLQRTRYRLPTAHFVSHFGNCNRYGFEMALAKTSAWAVFAGFSEENSSIARKLSQESSA